MRIRAESPEWDRQCNSALAPWDLSYNVAAMGDDLDKKLRLQILDLLQQAVQEKQENIIDYFIEEFKNDS